MSKNALRKPAEETPILRTLHELCDDVRENMQKSIASALRAGLILIHLHRTTGQLGAPGGFRAALDSLASPQYRIPPSTAYRWINAAAVVLAKHQGVEESEELTIPEPGTTAWVELEGVLVEHSKGMSLRRILLGSADTSEDSRLDQLISREEQGDKNATEILEQVAAGKLTLVQAVRALGGKVTKEKNRTDPVYLDIDGRTGQPTGLFPKCLVTIANTFSRWEQLDEAARREVKTTWKEVVSKLPKELR